MLQLGNFKSFPLQNPQTSKQGRKKYQKKHMEQAGHTFGNHHNNINKKIQFRRIIVSRDKHNRIDSNDPKHPNHFFESKINSTSRSKYSKHIASQFQVQDCDRSDRSHIKRHKQRNMLYEQKINQKKDSFINKLEETKMQKSPDCILNSEPSNDKELKPYQNVQQLVYDLNQLREPISTNKKFQNVNMKIKIESKITNQKPKNNQAVKLYQSSRPLSSASNISSSSKRLKQIGNNIQHVENGINQTARQNLQTQRSFYTVKSKMEIKSKYDRLQEIVDEFNLIDHRINKLIQQKWELIQQRLANENQNHHKQHKKISQSRLRQKSEDSKFAKEQKSQFSHSIAQKNIDLQVINQIKKLRSLDFNNIMQTEEDIQNLSKFQTIKQQLDIRRSQIIEKALAESMVESQLLKKYYSGKNYNGLSSSNHKVGQQSTPNKIKLKNSKSSIKRQIIFSQERLPSQTRDSVTKESQSKIKYNKHKEQDYEKFRYKHPKYKPNLQPLPRSSYKSQFLSYGNIKAYDDPYREQSSMIFAPSYALKSSSYRSEYKMLSPEKIDYKQLDAYKDKYKQLSISYVPKKRCESEARTLRMQNKYSKFFNQVQYVKKLKTDSLIDDHKRKQISRKVAKQMFLSESKKKFQNPQKSPQYYIKSEIKNKNLMSLKYDLKKKFHV